MNTTARPTRGRRLTVGITTTAMVLAGTAAFAANPASTTTTNGETLNIQIDTPLDGSTGTSGDPVDVAGVTGIGGSGGGDTGVLVIDLSASTTLDTLDCDGNGAAGDSGDDFNGDGVQGDRLDCEISGGLALFDSTAAGVDFGIVAFGTDGAIADVGPATGDQGLTDATADDDGEGTRDLEQVLRSADSSYSGTLSLFSSRSVGNLTSFDAALDQVAALTAPISGDVITFFLSDGEDTVGYDGDPGVGPHVTVNTYAVGSGASCSGGLQTIADDTGGTCTVVADPTTLSAALSGPVGIAAVDVRLNGGGWQAASLDSLGNFDATNIGTLVDGPNLVEARVTADDGTQVIADVTVTGEPPAPTLTCETGLSPTDAAAMGYTVILGSNAAETLTGTPAPDAIYGRGGNDTINGRGGDDCIFAGGGNDYVGAGGGNDTVFGQGGSDKIDGNNGDDTLDGGAGSFSIIDGGGGFDVCTSSASGENHSRCETGAP